MRRKQDAVELKDEQEQETAVSESFGLSRAFPSTDDRTIWYCLDRPKPRLRGVLHKWCIAGQRNTRMIPVSFDVTFVNGQA